MYPAYNTTKQAVNTDDTSGIRTIYNSRQNDFFDANGTNDSTRTADDISSYIDSNGQLTLSALDSTTPVMIGTNDIDWYKITVPASTTGTMVVRMQSTNLSLLAPTLAVYNGAGTTMLGQQISYNMGDTVTVTITNVSAGQVYDIRGQGSTTGDSGFGAYGLQVNFGSLTQPPVTAPNTTMAEAADQGGGTLSESTDDAAIVGDIPQDGSAIPGVPTFWVYNDDESTVSEDNGVVGPADNGDGNSDPSDSDGSTTDAPPPDGSTPTDGQVITVGDVTGLGDALMINDQAARAAGPAELPEELAPWTPLWQPPRPITLFRPAFTAGQANQNLLTGLDFFSGNDPTKAVFPIFSHAQESEARAHAARDCRSRPGRIVERSAEVRDHAPGRPRDNPRRVAAGRPRPRPAVS